MSDNTLPHPSEEKLYGCVSDDCDEATRRHFEQCSECSEFVDSIRSISKDIASMEENAVPEQLDDAVLAITGRGKYDSHHPALPFWTINPLSIGLLSAMLLIALGVALVLLM